MGEERRKQAGHQMQIRFPEDTDLREKLKEAAKAGHRSVNAEIMARLEFTFANSVTVQKTGFDVEGPENLAGQKTLEQRVAELEDRVASLEGRKRSKG